MAEPAPVATADAIDQWIAANLPEALTPPPAALELMRQHGLHHVLAKAK